MNKSTLTILSVTLIFLGSVFAYNFLNKGQEDTKLNLISLNPIDNTASFLWIDKKQVETTFYFSDIQIDKSSSNSNPYFELIFILEDFKNISYSYDGFKFYSNVGEWINKYTLRVHYNELVNTNDIEIKLTANTEIVDEGNYFLNVKLVAGTFDLSVLNNSKPTRLDFEVNEKLNPLKIWLLISFILLLLAISAWFLLLKKEYFPTFSKKGQLNIYLPDSSTIFLDKNARKLIFGNKLKEKENFFTKLFFGKVQYEHQISNHAAIITPYIDWKTKKVLYRLSCKGDTNSEIINEESYLKHLDKYKLITNQDVISFEYFNIKHY